jgi:Tfp pilus assembly protein PilO
MLVIIASVGCIAGALYTYSSLVQPAYEDVQVLRAKRDSALQTLAETEHAIEAIKALATRYESLTELKNNFSLLLPEGEELPTIINQIERIAVENDIAIVSMVTDYEHPQELSKIFAVNRPVHSIRLDMRLEGGYENIKAFLNDVQMNTRITDVLSFKVNGGGAFNNDGLEYSVIAQTYYQE